MGYRAGLSLTSLDPGLQFPSLPHFLQKWGAQETKQVEPRKEANRPLAWLSKSRASASADGACQEAEALRLRVGWGVGRPGRKAPEH